jgi:hypothetical protein
MEHPKKENKDDPFSNLIMGPIIGLISAEYIGPASEEMMDQFFFPIATCTDKNDPMFIEYMHRLGERTEVYKPEVLLITMSVINTYDC